jgi:transcriptional regulator with XRE-family HTH domain
LNEGEKGLNVLKPHLRISIQTLLERGATQREIERFTGVDRKTIRRYQRNSNSPRVATGSESAALQISPPRPPAQQGAAACQATRVTPSACEPYRAWIEAQVGLGRNAVSNLVEIHGFTHAYNSVKRFVARLKARAPERFDVLEFLPGE